MYELWNVVDEYNLKDTNLHIKGYSLSTAQTGFYIKEMKMMLDCGIHSLFKPTHVFITHGHSDHYYEVARIGKKSNIYVPNEIVDDIKQFIHITEKLNGYTLLIENINNIIGVNKNDTIHISNDYYCETFECYHNIPTIGYGFFKKIRKLKKEYEQMESKELIQHKKNGIDITYEFHKKLFCYLCDTTIDVFNDQRIFEYRTVMIECTFLFSEHVALLDRKFHIHWNQLEEYVKKYPHIEFILFHFSLRYKKEEIHLFFSHYSHYQNIKIWI